MNPRFPIVYRAYHSDGRLLYIGCSFRPTNRLHYHATTAATWWPHVTRIDVEHFDTVEEARAAEAHAISTERPLVNQIGNDPLRHFEWIRENSAESYAPGVLDQWEAEIKEGIRLNEEWGTRHPN